MQVSNSNNVKIYNLSCGKSLPDWISERKRRLLQKKDVGIRQRIELIQDFDMPGLSNGVKVSRDGKFIFATGIYKPRIRCYDVDNLSMKFERCFDAEAVQFELLSDDYSKFVILQCDRSVEFHVRYGMYYKIRIPKFGRDLAYHQESGDLLVVGASSEIYRLNLEQGRFLSSYQTEASSINKVLVHPEYDIIACGTMEGKVESWDPRMRERIGTLDCALSCMTENTIVEGFPSVTSLYFKEGLTLAVGTFTGQVLLYDIRTNKPFLVKDHMYGLPIKNIDFIKKEELIVSLDPKCVKFWDKQTGKPYTTIQAPAHLNDLCLVQDTGLLFLANEDVKILTYFLPSLGPAPKWCSFLDSITEELEESKNDTVYDDYKFVTKKELEELHLDHLQGTNLLRAYMHGFFMDIRLYNKAKAIVQPTAYKDVRKKMVRDKIEMERKNYIGIKPLPNVNRALAEKLLATKDKDKQVSGQSLLEDPRFKSVFEDPTYEANEADEYFTHQKTGNDKKSKKKATVEPKTEQMDIVEEEESKKYEEYTSSEYGDSEDDGDDEEEDDEEESESDESDYDSNSGKKPKSMFEAVDSERFSMVKKDDQDDDNLVSIGERLKNTTMTVKHGESSGGNKIVTFTVKKEEKLKKRDEERKAHLKERAKFRRSTKYLRK